MVENHTIELLKAIRADIAGVKHEQGITNLRLASIEDKMSAESLYHLALRDEVAEIKQRLDRLEHSQGLSANK
jgi:hypothetical protein